MKKQILFALLLLAGGAVDTHAQTPPNPPPSSYYPPAAVTPASLSVTSSSARVVLPALPSAYPAITIVNNGPSEIFCRAGDATVTATTSAYTVAVPSGGYRGMWNSTATYVACVTSSSTATARITQSNGAAQLGFNSVPASLPPSGAAGGDLSGTYPNPSVASYNGGTAFGTAAAANTGTSGATVPLLNGTNTYSGVNTFTAAPVINQNAASVPTPVTGVGLVVSPADGVTGRVQANGYGAIAAFTGARYAGTAASPTAVQANDQIGGFNGYAYDGTTLDGPIASFRTYATDTITSAHWGSKACIATSATNTVTLADKFCVDQAGNGTLTGQLLGATGTAPLPALSSSADPNTGFYFNADHTIRISVNGTQKLQIGSAGQFTSVTSSGFALVTTASTATAPTVIPNQLDATTGLGGVSGHFAAIAGGVNQVDCISTGCTFANTITATNGVFSPAAFSAAPIYIGVHGLTVLTAGSPADLGTITIPAGITRWRPCGAAAISDPFLNVVPRTWTATQAAAVFRVFDQAGGAGTDLTNGGSGGPTVSSGQVVGGIAANNQLESGVNTVYVRQTVNSANSGTDDFYIKVCPLL